MAELVVAKVYSDTTQTIHDNQSPAEAFTFTDAEYDPEGFWDIGASTRLTVPTGMGGVPYLIMGGSWTNNQVGVDSIMFVTKNASPVRGGAHTSVHPNVPLNTGQPQGYVMCEPVLDIPADGDFYELRQYIDQTGVGGGGNMTYGHASEPNAQTWFALIRLAT